MASIQKTAKGYRVQIQLLGVRDSKTFPSKRDASDWANRRETEIREEKKNHPGERHTLREALRKYAEEVTPKKRGARWEEVRLAAWLDTDEVLRQLSGVNSMVEPSFVSLPGSSLGFRVFTGSLPCLKPQPFGPALLCWVNVVEGWKSRDVIACGSVP